MRRLLARPGAVFSIVILSVIALAALAAPLIADAFGYDVTETDLLARYEPPSLAHWLGTDEVGRDVLLRMLYGARVSIAVGLVAALLAAIIGTAIGLLAGWFGGRIDVLLMRFTDGVIALPLLPLLIVLAAVDLRKIGLPQWIVNGEQISLYRIIVITALVGWTTVARLVRGQTLALRARDFVRSAIAMGAGPLRIMIVHILPNAISPIVVATTLAVGNIILFESVLSFLGLGIQPPLPSWGNMLSNAQETIWQSPLLAVYPGMLILITVACCNLLGDALQAAYDPRRRLRTA
ncbi:MAG: ABC transporter permease [Alphaproteobacteria bacterium]|nr:ABC transporter permease [Alphaproteobacteria bacterium]